MKLKKFLLLYCLFVLFVMIAGTVRATLDRGIFSAANELGNDPWFQVTLLDTYFSFLVIYFWIAYKETAWLMKILWFVLVMTLGNIAIAFYIFIQVLRWNPNNGVKALLIR